MTLQLRLLAPLLLATAAFGGAPFLLPPTLVEAASTCSLVFDLFDADATNGTNLNPGGTATTLAAPGFTNAAIVAVDLKTTSPATCGTQTRAGGWYVLLSRWVGSLYGKKLDWAAASTENSNNYAQVDQVRGGNITSPTTNDQKNDFGLGTTANSTAASLDLSAAGTATLTTGSTVTVYGDLTTCTTAQGSTPGFAPAYVRRSAGELGAYYWLNNAVANANSSYLAPSGGSETQGGGGKGSCLALAPTHSTDTIFFDDTAPLVGDLRTADGRLGTTTLVVSLDTSDVSDDGSGLWLMAFSNTATCGSGVGAWSPWEPYAASRTAWDLSAAAYGGSGSTTEGARPICIRVVDKAGNIEVAASSLLYDKTVPVVVSFTSPITSTYGLTSYDYTLAFSETVSGLGNADVVNIGTATGCSFSPNSSSGTTFTITVSRCSASGTLTPLLAANGVKDRAGNTGPAGAVTATTTLTLGQKPPLATIALAIASDTGASSSDHITKAASLGYTITFDETVAGLTAADFAKSGTVTGCAVTNLSGSGKSYSLTVTNCSAGTLTLSLPAGKVLDADKLGNLAASAATVTIDRTGPSITALCTVEDEAGLRPACNIGAREPVRILFAAGDNGAGLAEGTLVLPTALVGCDEATADLPLGKSQGVGVVCSVEGRYAPSATVTDLAGNSTTLGLIVFVDYTAPLVTIRCSLTRYGTYGSCPTGTVRSTRYVKLSTNDVGTGFAAKAFRATSSGTCTLLRSSLAAGNKQWKIYRCAAYRTFMFTASAADRAGNGPMNLAATWRKRQ